MDTLVDVSRFVEAQQRDFCVALREVRNGRKESHWMWYIFPQFQGLGKNPMSKYYAIQNLDEAVAFLKDSYLGSNM